MKVIVYAVQTVEGWTPYWTVDWSIDRRYWLDGGFREGVGEAIGPRGIPRPSEATPRLVKLMEPLPLGWAEAVCDRLKAEWSGRSRELALESVRTGMGQALQAVVGEGERGNLLSTMTEIVTAGGAGAKDENEPGRGNAWEGSSDANSRAARSKAEGRALAERLPRLAQQLAGRSLLREEAASMLAAPDAATLLRELQLAALLGAARLSAAIAPAAARGPGLRCRRCGSAEARMRRTACASCGRSGCAVCEACLALGRSRECALLARGAEPGASVLQARRAGVPAADELCGRWGLSPAQRRASEAAVRFLRGEGEFAAGTRAAQAAGHGGRERGLTDSGPPNVGLRRTAIAASSDEHGLRSLVRTATARLLAGRRRDPMALQARSFLLWAVTGAGKTEMIFPLLEAVLSAGGRALIATPRRDVVLELAPRLAKAFPGYSRAVLYGGSEERWHQAALTLSTTHQLLRFQEAFDLVLVDELDAFPYHNDPMLHYAAAAARKPDGATVLLSATPPTPLRRAASRGRLPHAKVPVRYHRHPLPVPRALRMPPLHRLAASGRPGLKAGVKLPGRLLQALGASVARGAQVFVFVPYIRQIDGLVAYLRWSASAWGISPEAIDGTSSKDEGRRDKVVAFRDRQLRLLVTTTILERGVTVPRSDVFIFDAHQTLFDEAALVQMAGRAGRSADDPAGRVYFCSAYHTLAQRGAIGQIRMMNRLARRGRYLLGSEEGEG
ncbi:DEAD/DEAH box helicase [Cohnella sp. REN36]|uniref:DEAD/DEAH box helicase n=1 Tax=Cohnella sp. REN36 TaxID=2887347 RepID=UPI001D13CF75|nr:helicase-related protein [Cohnella sp. REN36]MCC3374084.1 DEAD/DEAH box helicase [Cohnella sp. REN36]